MSEAGKFDHSTLLFKDLRWLPVKQQLYFRLAGFIIFFLCMTGRAPVYLTSKFAKRSAVSTRTTRNSEVLRTPLFRSVSGQRSFEYRATFLCSTLQPELKLSESVKSFKHQLCKYYTHERTQRVFTGSTAPFRVISFVGT